MDCEQRAHMRLGAIAFASLAAASCGSTPADGPAPPPPVPEWLEQLRDASLPVEQRVAAAITGIDEDPCLDQNSETRCHDGYYGLGEQYLDPEIAANDALLIIDLLPSSVEFLRYRSQIAAYYNMTDHGELVPKRLEWPIPTVLGEILTGLAASPELSPDGLAPLAAPLWNAYGGIGGTYDRHGTRVFGILIDRIPRTPVVLINSTAGFNLFFFAKDLVCGIGYDGSGQPDTSRLEAAAIEFSESLRQLMARHNVHFINASFGIDMSGVTSLWQGICKTPLPTPEALRAILMAHKPIFDVLFNTPGVFASHAAIEVISDDDSPFDIASPDYPNRLRIGVFSYLGSDIPVQGTGDAPSNATVYPGPTSADAFVNLGCADGPDGPRREGAFLTKVDYYGVGSVPECILATSWAAPLALAEFIHERNEIELIDREMDDALIRDVVDAMIPVCDTETQARCRYQDPLYHHLFDLDRH
jgi:hypothetical protein